MKEEFNLSKKIIYRDLDSIDDEFIYRKDVKEFIKRLKREITKEIDDFKEHHTLSRSLYDSYFYDLIDKLAGDKLI